MADRYAGIDWASEKHDVLVAEETGTEVLAATYRARREGAERVVPRAGAFGGGAGRDRAAGRAAGRAAAWMRGCRCWRCIRTRWRRRVTGSGSRAGSRIGLTRSCCASSRAPIITASGCSSPIRDQTKAIRALTRAREDLVAAAHRDRQPAACRARAVLARAAAAVQRTWTRRSCSRSLSATPARRTRTVWEWRGCRRFSCASGTPAGSIRPR